MKTRLIIFARQPQDGRVKTRLLAALTPGQVTSLYKAFIKDVLKAARQVPCSEKVIYYTGSRTLPFLGKYKKQFRLKRQSGSDLGERMYRAFGESERAGFGKTVIIGTDIPHIDSASIKRAFQRLTSHDIVLGPSGDGGYYLIGLRKANLQFFSGIRWGTKEVLPVTIMKARRSKKKVYQLNPMDDIDTIDDLKRFMRAPRLNKQAVHSWKMMRSLKKKI